MQGHQLVHQAQGLWRVAHDHQVEFVVHHHVAQLEQGLDGVGHVLGLGIGQVEALDAERLVVALLGRRGRVDQHRAGVQHAVLQLVGQQHQAQRRLDRGIAQKDRGALVGAQVLVEDEVQPGGTRDHLEHGAQAGVLELDRQRLAEGCRQRFLGRRRGAGHVQALQRAARCRVARAVGQHGLQRRARRRPVLARHRGIGLGQQALPLHLLVQSAQAVERAVGPRPHRQRVLVAAPCGVVIAAQGGLFGAFQQGGGQALALAHQRAAVDRRLRVQHGGLLQVGQCLGQIALAHLRLGLAVGLLGRAAGQQGRDQQAGQQPPGRVGPVGKWRGCHADRAARAWLMEALRSGC